MCYFLVPGYPEFSLPHPPSSQCTIPSNISTTTSLICPSIPFGGGVANPTTISTPSNTGTSTNNNGGLGASGASPILVATVPCKSNCIEDSMPTPCETLKIAYSEIPQFYNTTLENALSDDREHGFVGSINFNSTTNQTVKNFALAPNVR